MAISLSNAISGKREPKRSNRWILKFENVPYFTGDQIGSADFSNGAANMSESLAIDLVSSNRPTLNMNSGEMARLNEKWKFAQNPTWEPLAVTFYDYDSGKSSAAQIMWRWMRTIYDVLNGTMGYAASYKVDASLILLGPGQTSSAGVAQTQIEIIEAWDLFGLYPNQLNTGELSYENADALRVSVDFNYDYANLHTSTDTGGAGGTYKGIA
jgi:hypothetical protein